MKAAHTPLDVSHFRGCSGDSRDLAVVTIDSEKTNQKDTQERKRKK